MHIYANSRMGEFYQCVSMILIMTMVIFQSGYLYALDYPRGDINGDGVINQDDVAPLRDLVMERNSDFRAYVQGDFNNDGVRDITDALAILNYNGDWDNDGVSDTEEAAQDPTLAFDPDRQPAAGQTGIPAALNLDQNGDGFAELVSATRIDNASPYDTDGDGTPNSTDDDDDGDGISDTDEEQGWLHTTPPDPAPPAYVPGPFITDGLMKDTDRDGLSDGEERDSNTNPLNLDSDGDGYMDGTEIAASTNPLDPASIPGKSNTVTGPDLTSHELEANRAFQEQQQAKRLGKGGGAIGGSGRGLGFQGPEGIGANFDSVQSDQFTGAFSYSIPIKVPPGRNGMQPNLALFYRSTNSHSWLGQGWDLNPGRIERSTRNGAPKYDNASNPAFPSHDGDPFTPLDNPDIFVYTTAAGGSQLVYTSTETVGADVCDIYHAEVDSGSFTRFIHHLDPNNRGGG